LSDSADSSSIEVEIPIPDPSSPAAHTLGSIDFSSSGTTSTARMVTDVPRRIANIDASTGAAYIPDIDGLTGATVPGDDPNPPVIEEAEWKQKGGQVGNLIAEGKADRLENGNKRVLIRNAVTKEEISTAVIHPKRGDFKTRKAVQEAPCSIEAGINGVYGDPVLVEDAPSDCIGKPDLTPTITDYPGDVINIFHAVAGNKALVAWPSRYCKGGSPNYALETSNPERLTTIAGFLGIDLDKPTSDDLYLLDMHGVAGAQQTVDYSDDKSEQNQAVGEVPYSCLWTARGTIEEDSEGGHKMVWRKAERLTSGRRDVNRVEVECVEGAGCAITWQEDPDGLRPGQGLGPGEGWSGAIAHSQTDVWYSYLDWSSFDMVEDPKNPDEIMTYSDFVKGGFETKPQVGIPMAMPMRLTDNAKCNVENPQPYCNGSAISENFPELLKPVDYGLPDMCSEVVEIPTGQSGSLSKVCVTEKRLPLLGNVAATRPRLGLFGYDSNGDQLTDSAWIVVEAEESKGMGAFYFDDASGSPASCEEGATDTCVVADDGKNIWYYSNGMSLTDASRNSPQGLLANLSGHGNMLNQPEVNWQTGNFYAVLNTGQMWDFGDYNYDIYRTEIARRGSLLAQPISKALNSSSRLAALPAWKQGIMNQGGPADVMVRRIVIPESFNPSSDNPYAFVNMACDEWLVEKGGNPYYPDGLCRDSAINLSATVPDVCIDSQGDPSETVACPTVTFNGAPFGVGDTNPVLQGAVQGEGNTTKVLNWHQCPGADNYISSSEDFDPETCEEGDNNLADQSWYNPLDVSKGHRGYLDGDFVMMLYAWSPNWRLNAKGSDRYDLYVRRSFDGAQTWTTLPESFDASNAESYSGSGTVTCETYRSNETQAGGELSEPRACWEYAAGKAEQARNVTQLKSMRFTTLDPRYAPTAKSIEEPISEEDTRDPSRYFIVYETGDNSTVQAGEAEPLNLYYSRAVSFGDHYQVWAEEDEAGTECYPSNPHEDENVSEVLVGKGFCNEWDALERKKDIQSSEASVAANPGGEFLYSVWAQWAHDDDTEELTESDAMFRRVWYIDDWVSDGYGWNITGSGQE